jgi:electron transfer flavoprotein alpha subunit
MLTAATKIAGETGDTVAAVWLGEGAAGAADRLGAHGATSSTTGTRPTRDNYVTLPKVEALQQLVSET